MIVTEKKSIFALSSFLPFHFPVFFSPFSLSINPSFFSSLEKDKNVFVQTSVFSSLVILLQNFTILILLKSPSSD